MIKECLNTMNIPIYIHVAECIKEKINKGILKPGDLIPSENELSKEYETSRMTIRKSLSLMANEGYIFPVHGKGNYVTKPDQTKYILYFDELNCIESHIDKRKLLGVNVMKPTEMVRFHLKIPKEANVVMIRSLMYSHGQPVIYDIKYFPYDKGVPIVEKEINYATFPEMVAKKLSPFSIKKELTIQATKSEGELNELLQLEEGHPLLLIEQKIITDKNRHIGWGQIYLPSEYCKICAESSIDKSKNIF